MTKNKKIALIKNCIESGHHIPIVVTPEIVMYWWEMINHTLFDSKLVKPKKIECAKFYKNTYGWCKPYGKGRCDGKRIVTLGISTVLKNLYELLVVIIHECIHHWEWQIKKEWNDNVMHGKNFYSWRETINDLYGAPLAASYVFK